MAKYHNITTLMALCVGFTVGLLLSSMTSLHLLTPVCRQSPIDIDTDSAKDGKHGIRRIQQEDCRRLQQEHDINQLQHDDEEVRRQQLGDARPFQKEDEVKIQQVDVNPIERQDDVRRPLSVGNDETTVHGVYHVVASGRPGADKTIPTTKAPSTSEYRRPVDITAQSIMNHTSYEDDTTVADRLYSEVRVLCWVMTHPDNLERRAVHVKRTWGRRCNKLLFFSSRTNTSFPTIGLETGEGREFLTKKTNRAFRYIYKNYYNDYDWFMRTDDDAYVIMENLRYFLSSRDTYQPIYFGHHFKTYITGGYLAGGPGIILGKEALKRFGEKSLQLNPEQCLQHGSVDDLELGRCMYHLGVVVGNTTDVMGRSRFHCFSPQHHLVGHYPEWFYKYDANGAKYGLSSMSDYAIGFHYVQPSEMYLMEYLTYHLRPYGIVFRLKNLNQSWKKG